MELASANSTIIVSHNKHFPTLMVTMRTTTNWMDDMLGDGIPHALCRGPELYKHSSKQELNEDLVNIEVRTVLAESRMSALTQDRVKHGKFNRLTQISLIPC